MFCRWCASCVIIVILLLASSPVRPVEPLEYAAVIDAGSTGSRIYVYSYEASDPTGTMAAVSHHRVRPSLSSFMNETRFDADALSNQFGVLVDYAKEHIPKSRWPSTPLMIAATAGLRRMDESLRELLMQGAKEVLMILASDFAFLPDSSGVISGNVEALYDIMAILPVVERISADLQDIRYGVIDLGGSSMQYAYQLEIEGEGRTCSSDKDSFFLRSFSGLGLIEGMETLLAVHKDMGNEVNPCVPPDGVPFNGGVVAGGGDFTACVALIKKLYLEKMLQVSGLTICSPSSHPNIVTGLDNVPPLLHLLGLAPLEDSSPLSTRALISPKQIADSAESLCAQPWQSLLEEVAPSFPSYRGHRACYGSALLFVLLEEVVLGKCGQGNSEMEKGVSEEQLLLPLAELPRYGELSWALGAALSLSLQVNTTT